MNTAKLFKNGNSQALRLPKEFAFEGNEVYIKRIGKAVVLLPKEESVDDFWAGLELFTDDFMSERDQLSLQEREDF